MSKLMKQRIGGYFLYAHKLTGFQVNKAIQSADLEKVKTIAIFSTSALGDFLLNTPAMVAIRNRFPAAKIILVVHKRNALLVEGSAMFDRILYWNGKANGVLSLARQLKHERVDATFILHSRAPYDIIVATLARSNIIVKDVYLSDYLGQPSFVLAPFLSINYDHRALNLHFIEQKTNLLEKIGIPVESLAMTIPVAYTPEKKVRRTVGVHAGASSSERCWSVNHFAQVIDWLLANYDDVDVELMGGPREVERNDRIISLVNHSDVKPRVVNTAAKTNLVQLVEKIASQACIIVGDTGPLHVSVAVKTPVIALFPAQYQYIKAHPLQADSRSQTFVGLENEGISSIHADNVIAALNRCLSGEKR